MAKKLQDFDLRERSTGVGGPLDVEMELVWSMHVALFNVETRASPANGGRIWMPAGGIVGPKSNGGRERTW